MRDQGEEPAKRVKKEEPDELFQDQKGQEIRNFVLNIVRNAPTTKYFRFRVRKTQSRAAGLSSSVCQ